MDELINHVMNVISEYAYEITEHTVICINTLVR